MTELDKHDALVAASVATAAALQPQANRLQWEKQWLRENRDAYAVITDKGRAGSAADIKPNVIAAAVPLGDGEKQPISVSTLASEAAQKNAPLPAPQYTATTPAIAPGAVPANGTVWAETAIRLQLSAAAAPRVPEQKTAGSGYRGAWQQFALWQDDDEVGAALRLDPAPAKQREIIATLRQWLREAGLHLRTLIVNGVRHEPRRPPRADGF